MAWAEGNKWGRLGAPVTDAIRRAALAGDSKRLRAAADRLLDSAAYGESWQERIQAFSFIADRLEGKAVARVETTNGTARELGLAEIVQAVLASRAAGAETLDVVGSAVESPLLADQTLDVVGQGSDLMGTAAADSSPSSLAPGENENHSHPKPLIPQETDPTP